MIADHTLRDQFRLKGGGVVSLVGAGGKTSLMFQLAKELSEAGEPVLTTTSTKIFKPGKDQSSCLIVLKDPGQAVQSFRDLLSVHWHLTAASEYLASEKKLKGYGPDEIQTIWDAGLFQWILVEADGAAGRPLKAPADHEPVIPKCSSWVIAVIGLDAINKPLHEKIVFRSRIYSNITGLSMGSIVTAESIADIIGHQKGLMKGSPSQARRFAFLNHADGEQALQAAKKISRLLPRDIPPYLEKVVYGNVRLK